MSFPDEWRMFTRQKRLSVNFADVVYVLTRYVSFFLCVLELAALIQNEG